MLPAAIRPAIALIGRPDQGPKKCPDRNRVTPQTDTRPYRRIRPRQRGDLARRCFGYAHDLPVGRAARFPVNPFKSRPPWSKCHQFSNEQRFADLQPTGEKNDPKKMHLSAAFVLLLLGLVHSRAEDSLSKVDESLESVDQPAEDLEEKERSKKHAVYGGYPFLPSVYPYGLAHQNLGLSSLIYPGLQGALNIQGALPTLQAWNLVQGSASVFPYYTGITTGQVQPVAPDVVVAQPGTVVEEVVEPIVPVATGVNYVAPVLEEVNQLALRPFGYPYYGAPDLVNLNAWRARHHEQLVLAGRPAVYTDVDVVAPVVGLPQYNYVL